MHFLMRLDQSKSAMQQGTMVPNSISMHYFKNQDGFEG